MEMHQVRYFVMLCETLNFTRAAERCNVSQPSLTRAIRLLEDELGGPLFNRERNNTHLTELGRLTEPHLREVLAQSQTVRARASAFFELRTARLKLGLARGLPLGLVEASLAQFATRFPDTEIVLVDDRPPSLRDALQRGELEIVVLPERPADLDELHYHLIAEDRVQVLVPSDHRFAGMNAVPLDELLAETLVCRESCAFLEAIERGLHESGRTIRPRITVGSTEWMAPIVRQRLGIGLVSGALTPGEGLVCRPLLDAPAGLDVSLTTKRGRLYSPPVKAFIDIALRPGRRAA